MLRRSLFSALAALVVALLIFTVADPSFYAHIAPMAVTAWHAAGVHYAAFAVGLAGKGLVLSTAPVVVTKDPRANELRAQADALQAELFDPTKKFTVEEVTKRTDEIASIRARMAAISRFDPQSLIDAKGGDDALKVLNPDGGDEGVRSFQDKQKEIRKAGIREFGSVDKMIRMLTQSTPLNERQTRVREGLVELTRTVVGTASDASGGEFLLPLEQVAEIFRAPNVQQSIFTRGRRYPVSGRTLRIPYKVQTLTAASGVTILPLAGGFADVSIVGEGGTAPTREPTFAQRLLTVYKWAAYSEIGDEVMADDLTGELSPAVSQSVMEQMANAMGERMTNGSGTSEPLGFLHSNNAALLVSASRTTGGTIVAADIVAMYARHLVGPNSYWSVTRRAIAPLLTLTLGTTSLVTFLPNLRDSVLQAGQMVGTLLGLPIVISDLQASLGAQGDIALVNPDYYAVAVRQAVTVESSIHFKFPQGITAYRFFGRAGGIPIPDGQFAYQTTGTTLKDPYSPFVVLPT